ncbi:MAG: MerR family transcriptional regulator [Clostridium tyrobutyricum]|jgi:DNA-binding transcriptional MerR regulator|uniref:MerR family transcriptional regulator n=1 Tax=Clostridium tyrobutyricum TaxID=1519 RepID=UPI00242D62A6|nr:MerR family transcriptional regulator [Clostridium tyrobutyricum]MCH4200168.1 MerR family transcriptional regulator [Clostridium tyrobutyricum]MCH4259736.1 MerR family transcriptional regulator [Clostridium tyrobutyricum]
MKKYSIKEACEKLNTNSYDLRYLEKVLALNIKRDNLKNRYYTDNDIIYLKNILELKNQGLNYKAIKTVLNAKAKINKKDHSPNNTKEILPKNNLSIIVKSINELNNTIMPKFKDIEDKIDNLSENISLENTSLKNDIEKKQEEHFKELDKKLSTWREKSKIKQSEKVKKPWYKKIFN